MASRPSASRERASSAAFENVVGEARESYAHSQDPHAFFQSMSSHPCGCCAFWGVINFLFLAFTILLGAHGLEPFPLDALESGNVGLDLPYDKVICNQNCRETKSSLARTERDKD